MTPKALAQAFGQLSADEQAAHLAAWAFCLTIDARDTYIPGTEGIADPARLRRFNELQHRLTCRLQAILRLEGEDMPDDAFIQYVMNAAKEVHATLLLSELAKDIHYSSPHTPCRLKRTHNKWTHRDQGVNEFFHKSATPDSRFV